MEDIRIASVICSASVGQTRKNLDAMAGWVRRARKKGAAVVCFPEMNVTGYSTREDIRHSAEPVPGPVSTELTELAAAEDIVILAGVAECDDAGHVYATHLVIHPDGKLGRYRKLHIAPPERDVFTPGSEIPVFEIRGLTFAIQLCYDAHFPELSTHQALKGAEALFIPHASPRGTPDEKCRSWMRHLSARAFDNAMFVVAVNQTGLNCNGLRFPGLALALDPSGEIIDSDLSGRQGLLLTDLKKSVLSDFRTHPMRYFLPNRRGDLFGNDPL